MPGPRDPSLDQQIIALEKEITRSQKKISYMKQELIKQGFEV